MSVGSRLRYGRRFFHLMSPFRNFLLSIVSDKNIEVGARLRKNLTCEPRHCSLFMDKMTFRVSNEASCPRHDAALALVPRPSRARPAPHSRLLRFTTGLGDFAWRATNCTILFTYMNNYHNRCLFTYQLHKSTTRVRISRAENKSFYFSNLAKIWIENASLHLNVKRVGYCF